MLKAIDIIGGLTGEQPASYRRPGFSISEKNEWALETIAECGFKYDSTIYPRRHGHGGDRRFSSDPVKIIFKRSGKELIEFPITVTKIFKKEMCFSGGWVSQIVIFLYY